MHNAAILTTGTELIRGEVLNTNAQAIATLLDEYYIKIRFHMTCADDQEDLIEALKFLSAHECDTVIINGGLGPTNDDLTREAVSEFTGLPLMRHENAYKKLKAFIALRNLEISESQKKQAYMPEGAKRLDNDNGTADGWLLEHDKLKILALPGPPHECLPILKQFLHDNMGKIQNNVYKSFFRVLHVPESEMSELLQNALGEHEKLIRYRAHYPYIDIKFQTTEHSLYQLINGKLQTQFANFHYWHSEETAIKRLRDLLLKKLYTFQIEDNATRGYFETKLITPSILSLNQQEPLYQIECSGLDSYWQSKQVEQFKLTTTIRQMNNNKSFIYTDLIRSGTHEPLKVAAEIIANNLLKRLV